MEEDKHIKTLQKLTEDELSFSYPHDDYKRWVSALKYYINELIQKDFNKLIFVLYRLDINESKLKKLLNDQADCDAGEIIGELIIERQWQKIKTREASKQNNESIDESEKW